jgi:hypothetical protein
MSSSNQEYTENNDSTNEDVDEEIQPCDDALEQELQQHFDLSNPAKRKTNTWGIYTISVDILTTGEKGLLTENTVSHEMSIQNPSVIPEHDKVHDYADRLKKMKRDIKKTTAHYYKKLCIQHAQKVGACPESKKGTCTTQQLWNEIGLEFMVSPTWENAEELYHIVYSTTDKIPNFKKKIEKHWMKTYGIKYSGIVPKGRYVTGIQRLISDKINIIRKDLFRKLSKNHGFKIVKSVSKKDENDGYKRRKLNVFNADFVTNIIDENCHVKSNKQIFSYYLKQIHGKNYKEYSATEKNKKKKGKSTGNEIKLDLHSLTDSSDTKVQMVSTKKNKTEEKLNDCGKSKETSSEDSFLSAAMIENDDVLATGESGDSNYLATSTGNKYSIAETKLYQDLNKEKKEIENERLLIRKEKEKLIQLQEKLKLTIAKESSQKHKNLNNSKKRNQEVRKLTTIKNIYILLRQYTNKIYWNYYNVPYSEQKCNKHIKKTKVSWKNARYLPEPVELHQTTNNNC